MSKMPTKSNFLFSIKNDTKIKSEHLRPKN